MRQLYWFTCFDSHSTFNHDHLNKLSLEKPKIANVSQSSRKKQGKNWKTTDLSKIYKSFILKSILPCVENFLSKTASAYKKICRSNHVLIRIIEKMKEALDWKIVGIVLMDLSKAFEFIAHNLLRSCIVTVLVKIV